MTPICATLMTLACLGPGPGTDGPLGVTPHVSGRFGVISQRVGGTTVTEPYAVLAAGLTWRHEFDNGARVAVSVSVVGDGLTRRTPRP